MGKVHIASAPAATRANGAPERVRPAETPIITWAERERLVKRNRALLDRELLEKRLTFESGPYEAHVQFSNFCNMSCIMCWDGENPPLKRMDPVVLAKVREQIAPSLSVITPHSASEPLVASWDATLAFARDYSVQLALTTNTQFLDRGKLDEIVDHVEMVVMSIDSHIPEVFDKIRPGGKSGKVFDNLPVAAAFCNEHGIECIVQAVFMTENAASMPDTVAYMADAGVQTVNVIQMIDTNRRSGFLDATLHFSSEYLEHIRQQCSEIARASQIRLGWDLDGPSWVDHRPPAKKVRARRSKVANDHFDEHMKARHPGFCKYAYDRLQIELDGNVEPCGLASEGELILGNLADQDFEEIWNGPSAQDLRRAHYTWDYPSICATCRYSDPAGAKEDMPFTVAEQTHHQVKGRGVEYALVLESPEHMSRLDDPPVFRFSDPGRAVERYELLLSLGKSDRASHRVQLGQPVERDDGSLELALPLELWERLDTNVGWWWALYAISAGDKAPHMRSEKVRCFIRHEEIPRIAGSMLRYPDQGHLSPTYLGGARQVGWEERDQAPPRPELQEVVGEPLRTRHVNRKQREGNENGATMTADEYAAIVAGTVAALDRIVPAGARALIVSKGDDALTRLRDGEAWHFPCLEDGSWGHYPLDDASAIDQVERERERGAQFLAFPSTGFWWLEHYRTFAKHLDDHYVVASEHQREHVIYDLREQIVPVA
jgi:radical SAM protein with 4Fe4S-binding SPASM domain